MVERRIDKLATVVYGPNCQHPTSRKAGMCGNPSIGKFMVPDSYVPDRRHADTPLMPHGDDIRLCLHHQSLVAAHIAELENRPVPPAGSHESQCMVCQHPRGKAVMELWVGWVMTATAAAKELGITNRSVYSHIAHFDLWERKAAKVNRKRALVIAAERGMEAGGHSPRTGIAALEQLRKEEDGNEINVNVRGMVGIADITKLSDSQLLQLTTQLLEEHVLQSAQKAVAAGPAIDVPFRSVDRHAERPVRMRLARQPEDFDAAAD